MAAMLPQRAEPPSPRLTLQEIYAAYPDSWVVLGDLERDPAGTLQIFSAVVRGHGKTRREAVEAAGEDDHELRAWRYTGRPKHPWRP